MLTGTSGDLVTIKNRKIRTLVFADGTTQSLLAAGNTYSGIAGIVTGTARNDVYSYDSGTGAVTIYDAGGENTLIMGTGLSAASVGFTTSGDDLLIEDGVGGDSILLAGQLTGTEHVQTLTFADGGSMALSGLALHEGAGESLMQGTTGNDTLISNTGTQVLNGNGGDDVYVIAAGNTTVEAGKGDDTYSYSAGDGLLTVTEEGGYNTLIFDSSINPASVSLSGNGHDLIITDGTGGDTITLKNQLDTGAGVAELIFEYDDTSIPLLGVELTAGVSQSLLYGTLEDDTLTATSGIQDADRQRRRRHLHRRQRHGLDDWQ